MGGLIASIAMARNPSFIDRAVLIAPMLRMKCATKALNYRFPVPQTVAHYVAYISYLLGLGTNHSLGYPNEVCTDKLAINTYTSDINKLIDMEALRQKHPTILSTCITNDWIRHSLQAQIEFSYLYSRVNTNCLIFSSTNDYFVYNRAMETFAFEAPNVKLLTVKDSYHELLFESDDKRIIIENQIIEFFNQKSDNINELTINPEFEVYDKNNKKHLRTNVLTVIELLIRGSLLMIGGVGLITGLSMLTGYNIKNINTLLKFN